MSHDRPTQPLPALDDTAVGLDYQAPEGYEYELVSPPTRRPVRRRAWILLALAVIGAAAGLGISWYTRSAHDQASRTASTGAVVVPVSVTSFDPSGGSGFQRTASGTGTTASTSWRTQTYRTAAFGNLKDGVGLVLDLGSPKALSLVTVDAEPGPITIELRTADQRPGPSGTRGMAVVGSPVVVQGVTKLAAANGGSHRYWVVWVSRLEATDGGFSATLSQPVALS